MVTAVNVHIEAGNILSEQQKAEIAGLIQACREQEPIGMEPLLEAEENIDPELPCFYLAYEKKSGKLDTLAGFLSLFLPDGETAEATVLVRPDCRRRGIMTALLEKAREMLWEEELSFYLVSDGNSRDGDAVAAHRHLVKDHTERMMEVRAVELAQPNRMHSGQPHREPMDSEQKVFLRSRGQRWYLYRKDCRNYIGKCCLIPLAETVIYLYGLEIRPEWRRQGYGRAFLQQIGKRLIHDSQGQSDPVLRLQVTSENAAACRLYESCGFQVSEQVIYYNWEE